MAPYSSEAQRGYFHAHPEKVGGEAVVHEWDEASKGKKLPEHVNSMKWNDAKSIHEFIKMNSKPGSYPGHK